VDDNQSIAAVRRALELGVNFFDTADVYGFGHSEKILGEALRGFRNSVVIASKVGNTRQADGMRLKDFSARHIVKSCDDSLCRLGTDYIDLYQLHNPTLDQIFSGDAGEALEKLQSSGKIRSFGVSISHPSEGLEIIGRNFGATLQVLYNVLNQKPADGLFNAARKNDCGIIVRVPLASALLTGKIRSGSFDPRDNRNNFLTASRLQEVLPKVDRYLELCRDYSLRPVQAALKFILAHPAVSTAIPGAKSTEQVDENVAACKAEMPPGMLESLRREFRTYNFYLRHGIKI
jgi:aryl-alcohol dehydrogenase-like predicted oxidoreductase